jgi:hypothetical protein
MKRLCLGGMALTLVVVCASVAMADSVLQVGDTIRFYDREGSLAGEFGVGLVGANKPELFRTFCMQHSEYMDFDSHGFRVAGISDHSETDHKELAPETAYLYYHFIFGGLKTPYDHGNGTGQHAQDADALQQAMWKYQQQINYQLTGKAKVFYDEAYAAVHGQNAEWEGLGPVRILNLTWATSRNGFAAGSAAQDQLAVIPLPAAAWMGAGLLGALFAVRRLRRAK